MGDNGLLPCSSTLIKIPSGRTSWLADTRVKVKIARACGTLCNPRDCSPPGSSVRGILQARVLEWVAMLSSRGSSQPRYRTCVSCISCIGRQILYPWGSVEALKKRYYPLNVYQPLPPSNSQSVGRFLFSKQNHSEIYTSLLSSIPLFLFSGTDRKKECLSLELENLWRKKQPTKKLIINIIQTL